MNINDELISKQAVLDVMTVTNGTARQFEMINNLPPADPTIYGYNIEQLELIASILTKENLPPERVKEALTDIGRILAIVKDEFDEVVLDYIEER